MNATLTPTPSGVVLPVTPLLRDVASVFAKSRQAQHADRPVLPAYGKPADAGRKELFGCISELAVLMSIEAIRVRMGLPVQTGFFHKGRTDLTLGTRLLEIKSVLPGSHYAAVNAQQFEEANPDTWYLFAVFSEDGKQLRVMNPVPHSAIKSWDYRTDKHSPYRSTHIRNLKPLHSLESLCSAA